MQFIISMKSVYQKRFLSLKNHKIRFIFNVDRWEEITTFCTQFEQHSTNDCKVPIGIYAGRQYLEAKWNEINANHEVVEIALNISLKNSLSKSYSIYSKFNE